MDFLRPLLRADRIAVERIDHRIAARAVPGIVGRQDDDDVAIGAVALQVALDRGGMKLDPLDRDRLAPGTTVGCWVVTWAGAAAIGRSTTPTASSQ